jgi:ribose transport system substrate-binding protein
VKRLLLSGAMLGALLALVGSAQAADKKTLVFVVNVPSDFWKAAEAGVKKAQGELPNYNLDFKYPEQGTAAIQTRVMDDLVAAGVSGIMVSAVDPKTMTDALDRVGKQVALFTTDSDAPKSCPAPTTPASASRASRTRSRGRKSSSSTCAPTTATRPAPSAMSRTP